MRRKGGIIPVYIQELGLGVSFGGLFLHVLPLGFRRHWEGPLGVTCTLSSHPSPPNSWEFLESLISFVGLWFQVGKWGWGGSWGTIVERWSRVDRGI